MAYRKRSAPAKRTYRRKAAPKKRTYTRRSSVQTVRIVLDTAGGTPRAVNPRTAMPSSKQTIFKS